MLDLLTVLASLCKIIDDDGPIPEYEAPTLLPIV